jgi:hypothetical protein
MASEGPAGIVLERREKRTGETTSSKDHSAKNPAIAKGTKAELPGQAGLFQLDRLHLISPNRKDGELGDIDLRASYVEFNIYEDISSPTLAGNITILDGIGLMESVPIIGEEILEIEAKTENMKKVRSPIAKKGASEGAEKKKSPLAAGSENDGHIKLKFRVYKISDVTDQEYGLKRYTLHFCTEEYLINLKTKVMKGFKEPQRISKSMKDLYNKYFGSGSKRKKVKKVFIEPTKNINNLIIPNYTPFRAFNFLASRAVSVSQKAAGSSFVFFETIKGHFFVSLETLMQGGLGGYEASDQDGGDSAEGEQFIWTEIEEKIKEVYTVSPKKIPIAKQDGKNIASEMVSVNSFKFSGQFDIVKNLQKGMYSNRLITHDLVRMKWDTLDYNYFDPNATLLKTTRDATTGATEVTPNTDLPAADKKNFFDTFAHMGAEKLSTINNFALGAPTSSVSLYPTNFAHEIRFPTGHSDLLELSVYGKPARNLNITPNRVEQWMQSRQVQIQQLENIKVNITAPGLSSRSVGDMIEFKLPSNFLENKSGGEAEGHKYYSGYYLITKLRHKFSSGNYTIEFEAVKDSLHKKVGGSRQNDQEEATTAGSTVSPRLQGIS